MVAAEAGEVAAVGEAVDLVVAEVAVVDLAEVLGEAAISAAEAPAVAGKVVKSWLRQ